ncbi:hypothetical protein [Siphonobacter sp.]|uniref:hypothetical protein n=1 Tax=Siphonobacter sp. TaxID=1869184 RepID=UPI003B3BCEF8
MRKYLLLLGFLTAFSSLYAQSKLIVKVGIGPSFPYGKFEDSETQDLAKLLKIGPHLGLTVAHDFSRHFGVALTASAWTHAVKNEEMTQYLKDKYLPAAYIPLVKSINASAKKFEFYTGYLSPYYTFEVGERIRIDLRLNAGIMHLRFPSITGQGEAINPLETPMTGVASPLTVSSEAREATAFMYGAGASVAYKLSETFRIFTDIDGLRARPSFDDIPVTATLGPVTLASARPAFSQTAGTLSVRFGVGLFF